MSALLAGWLLTYLAHSTLLLALAWLASRLASGRRLALREMIWRLALFGGLLTASLQLAIGGAPIGGPWSRIETRGPDPARPLARPAVESLGVAVAIPPPPHVPPTAAAATPAPVPWPAWLIRVWILIGLPLLALLATSYLRLRWRLRGRRTLDDGDLLAFLRRLEIRSVARGRRSRPVRLSRSARIGVPLARGLGRGEICLPEEALERLSLERQETVVAHELAHLDRRDPLWFALTRIVERALFFQPLNALARRQLQEISEFRCDDWAVAVTRRPISLAKCLTEVAEWRVRGRVALPVPTMAAGKTHLSRRVARLLERSYPMPSESVPRWLAPAALAVLLLTILIAPGVSAHAPPLPEPPAEPTAPVLSGERPPSPPRPAPPLPPSPVTAPAPPAPAAPVVEPARMLPEAVLAELDPIELSFAELAGELEADLLSGIAPLLAELSAEIEPALAAEQAELAAAMAERAAERAAEIAAQWTESLELDREQVGRLREMAERLEAKGHATEEESARLAEMAERLIETARPNREQIERVRQQAREMAEAARLTMTAHRTRMAELERSEREAMERARAEIELSLEERRELLERARRSRAESLRELEREHRERLRQEMLRSRELLEEQLRQLDEELERQDREEAEEERSQPFRE